MNFPELQSSDAKVSESQRQVKLVFQVSLNEEQRKSSHKMIHTMVKKLKSRCHVFAKYNFGFFLFTRQVLSQTWPTVFVNFHINIGGCYAFGTARAIRIFHTIKQTIKNYKIREPD